MRTAATGAILPAMNRLPDADFAAYCRVVRAFFMVPAVEISIDGAQNPDITGYWMDAAPGAAPGTCPFVIAEVAFGSKADGRLRLRSTEPRTLDTDAMEQLRALSALAGQTLELYRAAVAAVKREAEFRLLAENSTDTIVRGDLNGIRLYISPSVKTLLGYEPAELIGKKAAEINHPDDAPAFGALMQQVQQGVLDVGVTELRQRHKDGRWVWMEASVKLIRDPQSGDATGYVASVRGIGPRKQAEARLEHLASHDVLTGLPNRALLNDRLEEAIARTRRDRLPFALFGMDLDRFKPVNDTLGHHAGDAVLQEVANRFRAIIRPGDTIARLGGDEFALIQMLKADIGEASVVARRLISAMSAPFMIGKTEVSIGLSIGIACTSDVGLDPDELLSAADRALYQAKTSGRNTFRFSGPGSGTHHY